MDTWIRKFPNDLQYRESSCYNLNFLYHQDNIYIMDNHLAAGWAWLQELDPKKEYNFFHIDQHEDLLNNAPRNLFSFLRDTPKIGIDDYCNLTIPKNEIPLIPTTPVFQWDNYIKQVQYLFPHWFEKCIFATHKIWSDDNSLGNGDLPLNILSCPRPTPFDLFDNICYWMKYENSADWILNLDLDYFFMNGIGQMFSDEYIRAMLNNIKSGMSKIAVFTIALSPECCGGWTNAIHVLDIVSDVFGLDINLKEK